MYSWVIEAKKVCTVICNHKNTFKEDRISGMLYNNEKMKGLKDGGHRPFS